MRHFLLIFIIISSFLTGCGTSRKTTDARSHATRTTAEADDSVEHSSVAPSPVNYHDQTTWLLGYYDPALLRREPHAAWFLEGLDEYMPNTDALNSLIDIQKDNITIKIVMGTWCPDSRREVPRFMKIMELWQFPADKITFIGVDDAKQSPVGDFASLNISRVPTFIFYKNNSEAGRIIEVPKTSLEQDIVNILSGNE
ncbi:MAG TPA: thioredoxin family protein [Bacteroidales bacterium]|nr:thioredoxin family protein [Bacteroidales bacterium]